MSAPTCLYCGKKLVFRCDTKYEKNPVPDCPKCGESRDFHSAHTNYSYLKGTGEYETTPAYFYCEACDEREEPPKNWHERRVVSRKRIADKPGAYADGFFCSLMCGFRFGVAAAKAGYRLVKKGE